MIQKIFEKHHQGFDILKCWGNRFYYSDWPSKYKWIVADGKLSLKEYTKDTIEQWYEVPFYGIDLDFDSIEQAEYHIEQELVHCL